MNPPDPRFAESIRLFNHGEYFESHEVMERLWLETKSDFYSDLYKGVIQCAAALFLLKRGPPQSGARALCKSAVKYLEKYAPETLGLDVAGLIRDMNGCFKSFEGWDGKGEVQVPEKLFPRLSFRSG